MASKYRPEPPRFVTYGTPEYDDEGDVIGMRYFPTVREVKEFAIEQMRKRGARAYGYDSLTREQVAHVLTDSAPVPDHWLRSAAEEGP